MSRVFVVHRQERWDAAKGRSVPLFDLRPAEQYGELVYVLPPDATPLRAEEALDQIWSVLRDNITPDDYLLLVGNPCLIAWTAAVAADFTGGRLRLLQWERTQRRYTEVTADVFGD